MLAAFAMPCAGAVAQDQTTDQTGGGFTTTVKPAVPAAKAKKKAAAPAVAAGTAGTIAKSSGSDTAILVVVNDEPISSFKVDQRIALNALSGNQAAQAKLQAKLKSPGIQDQFRAFATKYNPKSQQEVVALQRKFVENLRNQVLAEVRPGLRDKVLMELIQERLQMQEAKRLELLVTDEELNDLEADLAKRNGKSTKDFEAMLATQNIRRDAFRDRLRVQASWQRVLSRRFRGQLSVANNEVDQVVATASAAPAGPEMQVQRAIIPQPQGDQTAAAASYAQAEKLTSTAKGCKNFEKLAKAIPGARFENLGTVTANSMSEQVRPILASAKAGDVPPPVLTTAGIEVYAVCKIVEAKGKAGSEPAEAPAAAATPDQQRDNARAKIERSKMDALSKGLLSDLCAKAAIDYRSGTTSKQVCGSVQ